MTVISELVNAFGPGSVVVRASASRRDPAAVQDYGRFVAQIQRLRQECSATLTLLREMAENGLVAGDVFMVLP